MDEGLPNETLPLSVPSESLPELVLISFSGYLSTHSRSAERQEVQCSYSQGIQTVPHVKNKPDVYTWVKFLLMGLSDFSDIPQTK